MKLFSLLVCSLFLAAGTANCGGNPPSSTQAQQGKVGVESATDLASLIEKLRSAGLGVEVVGEVDQPFLSVTGTMIKLQGDDVQVFQYLSAAEMEAQAAPISRDGMAIGTRKIFWVGPPHFFKQGKLLVLYVGNDDKVLKALEGALGPQFAGQ